MAYIKRRLVPNQTVSITSGLTSSAAIDISEVSLPGIIVPKFGVNTNLTISVAVTSASTFSPLKLSDLSSNWSISSTGNFRVFVPDLAPFSWMKLNIGTTQTTKTFGIVGRS